MESRPASAKDELGTPGAILQNKPVVVAIPTPEPVTETGEGDAEPTGFAVQVGAFGSRETASRVAGKAAKLLPKLAKGSRVEVSRIHFGKTIYAARLSGFSKPGADRLCTALKKKKHDCLVVKLDGVAVN